MKKIKTILTSFLASVYTISSICGQNIFINQEKNNVAKALNKKTRVKINKRFFFEGEEDKVIDETLNFTEEETSYPLRAFFEFCDGIDDNGEHLDRFFKFCDNLYYGLKQKEEFLEILFKSCDLRANFGIDNSGKVAEFVEAMIMGLLSFSEYCNQDKIKDKIWGNPCISTPFLNCLKKADKIRIGKYFTGKDTKVFIKKAIDLVNKSENDEIKKEFAFLFLRTDENIYKELFCDFEASFLEENKKTKIYVDNIYSKKNKFEKIISLLRSLNSTNNRNNFTIRNAIYKEISKIEKQKENVKEDFKNYLKQIFANKKNPMSRAVNLIKLSNEFQKSTYVKTLIEKEIEKTSNLVDVDSFWNFARKNSIEYHEEFSILYRLYNCFKNFKIGGFLKKKSDKTLEEYFENKEFDHDEIKTFIKKVLKNEIKNFPVYRFEGVEKLGYEFENKKSPERTYYKPFFGSNTGFLKNIGLEECHFAIENRENNKKRIETFNKKTTADKIDILMLNEIILVFLDNLVKDFDLFKNNKEMFHTLALLKREIFSTSSYIVTGELPISLDFVKYLEKKEAALIRIFKKRDDAEWILSVENWVKDYILEPKSLCDWFIYEFSLVFLNAVKNVLEDESCSEAELKGEVKKLSDLLLKVLRFFLEHFSSTLLENVETIINFLKKMDCLENREQAENLNLICKYVPEDIYDKRTHKTIKTKDSILEQFIRLSTFSKAECQGGAKFDMLAIKNGRSHFDICYDYYINLSKFSKFYKANQKVLKWIFFDKIILKNLKSDSLYMKIEEKYPGKIRPTKPEDKDYYAFMDDYTKSVGENPFKKAELLLTDLLNEEGLYDKVLTKIENISKDFTFKNIISLGSKEEAIKVLNKIKEKLPSNSLAWEPLSKAFDILIQKEDSLKEKLDFDEETLVKLSKYFNGLLKNNSLNEQQKENVLLNFAHFLSTSDTDVVKKQSKNINMIADNLKRGSDI